jgi:hypothetical protein
VNVSEVMPLILTLRNEVWLLWGLLATFNTALIGWLLEKGSKFQEPQQIVATVGYLMFCTVMVIGFVGTYQHLEAAVKDLEAAVEMSGVAPARGGLVDLFRHKRYTNNLIYAVAVTSVSFVFIASLVWTKWLF